MAKKKTTKKTKKKKTKLTEELSRSFTIRLAPVDVDWLDETAAQLHTSRQQVLHTMIKGMRLADQEASQQGTFMNLYASHLEAIVQDAIMRSKK
jgi:hypothetical protein